MRNKKRDKIEDKVIEFIYTDKKRFCISLDNIEELIKKSTKLDKVPLLILSFKRNKNEIIKLVCEINIERK